MFASHSMLSSWGNGSSRFAASGTDTPAPGQYDVHGATIFGAPPPQRLRRTHGKARGAPTTGKLGEKGVRVKRLSPKAVQEVRQPPVQKETRKQRTRLDKQERASKQILPRAQLRTDASTQPSSTFGCGRTQVDSWGRGAPSPAPGPGAYKTLDEGTFGAIEQIFANHTNPSTELTYVQSYDRRILRFARLERKKSVCALDMQEKILYEQERVGIERLTRQRTKFAQLVENNMESRERLVRPRTSTVLPSSKNGSRTPHDPGRLGLGAPRPFTSQGLVRSPSLQSPPGGNEDLFKSMMLAEEASARALPFNARAFGRRVERPQISCQDTTDAFSRYGAEVSHFGDDSESSDDDEVTAFKSCVAETHGSLRQPSFWPKPRARSDPAKAQRLVRIDSAPSLMFPEHPLSFPSEQGLLQDSDDDDDDDDDDAKVVAPNPSFHSLGSRDAFDRTSRDHFDDLEDDGEPFAPGPGVEGA